MQKYDISGKCRKALFVADFGTLNFVDKTYRSIIAVRYNCRKLVVAFNGCYATFFFTSFYYTWILYQSLRFTTRRKRKKKN